MSTATDEKSDLFWALAEPLISTGAAERGTMMGFPCLRTGGKFFASLHHQSSDLIVKLPRERVLELIEAGVGESFAPAGRTFREWVAVVTPDEARWDGLIREAREFVLNG